MQFEIQNSDGRVLKRMYKGYVDGIHFLETRKIDVCKKIEFHEIKDGLDDASPAPPIGIGGKTQIGTRK